MSFSFSDRVLAFVIRFSPGRLDSRVLRGFSGKLQRARVGGVAGEWLDKRREIFLFVFVRSFKIRQIIDFVSLDWN